MGVGSARAWQFADPGPRRGRSRRGASAGRSRSSPDGDRKSDTPASRIRHPSTKVCGDVTVGGAGSSHGQRGDGHAHDRVPAARHRARRQRRRHAVGPRRLVRPGAGSAGDRPAEPAFRPRHRLRLHGHRRGARLLRDRRPRPGGRARRRCVPRAPRAGPCGRSDRRARAVGIRDPGSRDRRRAGRDRAVGRLPAAFQPGEQPC